MDKVEILFAFLQILPGDTYELSADTSDDDSESDDHIVVAVGQRSSRARGRGGRGRGASNVVSNRKRVNAPKRTSKAASSQAIDDEYVVTDVPAAADGYLSSDDEEDEPADPEDLNTVPFDRIDDTLLDDADVDEDEDGESDSDNNESNDPKWTRRIQNVVFDECTETGKGSSM